MILALSFTYLAIYPLSMKLVIAGGAFISTAVMPGFFILLFVKSGAAGDLELTDRKERFVPYFIFIVSIGACFYLMLKLMMPVWILVLLGATAISLLIGMAINIFWKISAGLVGTSRIFLGRHTPMQVYAGFILGFFCTFTASILSYIYLFI
jgi:hypothetical protein